MVAQIAVSQATQERLNAVLANEATVGSDSLVNLALDAYELLAGLEIADWYQMPPTQFNRFKLLLGQIRDGSHYAEVA